MRDWEHQLYGKTDLFFNSTGSRNTSWETRSPFQPTLQNSNNSCSTHPLQLHVFAKPAHNPDWATRGKTQPWGNTPFPQNTPPLVHGLIQTTTWEIILSPRAVLATVSVSAEGHLLAEFWLPLQQTHGNKTYQAAQVNCSRHPLQLFCKDLYTSLL